MQMLWIAFLTLAGGGAGFVFGAVAASFVAAVLHMSRLEGGVGVFAIGVGPISGLLGVLDNRIFKRGAT